MNTLTGLALEQALASKLEELLSSVPWLRDWHVKRIGSALEPRFDLKATLPLPEGKVVLAIECKSELRPSAFQAMAERKTLPGRTQRLVPVLAMPFVSRRLADICVQHGWSWYDLAGNCHIVVPNAIYLERCGHEPKYTLSRPVANLSTPEAARVIRALLVPENAGKRWTQRSVETH